MGERRDVRLALIEELKKQFGSKEIPPPFPTPIARRLD
jgi:hypothetical protein